MTKTHKCAAIGCPKKVCNSRLMCRDHWFALPRSIRTEVLKWHGAKTRGVVGADEYSRVAVRAAMKWLKDREPQKSLF